jgi:hypothetical protein
MSDPFRSDHERWLFGAGPWTWRVGVGALDPRRHVRQYRSLRRRRPMLTGGSRRTIRRYRAARFVAWTCWQELTGWRRPCNQTPGGVLFWTSGMKP